MSLSTGARILWRIVNWVDSLVSWERFRALPFRSGLRVRKGFPSWVTSMDGMPPGIGCDGSGGPECGKFSFRGWRPACNTSFGSSRTEVSKTRRILLPLFAKALPVMHRSPTIPAVAIGRIPHGWRADGNCNPPPPHFRFTRRIWVLGETNRMDPP